MRRIKDKLRETGGATILMALFALLVASLVCIVILSASVTTVKQSKVDQQHEQDMLLLQSAGELVASNIGNGATTVTYKTIETWTKNSEDDNYSGPVVTHEGPSVSASLISEELRVAAKSVIVDHPESDSNQMFFGLAIQSNAAEAESDTEESRRIAKVDGSTVEASFVLRKGNHDAATEGTGLDYQLVFTFKLLRDGKVAQTLFMKMDGNKDHGTPQASGEDGDPQIVTTTVDTYSWGSPTFYLADGQEG